MLLTRLFAIMMSRSNMFFFSFWAMICVGLYMPRHNGSGLYNNLHYSSFFRSDIQEKRVRWFVVLELSMCLLIPFRKGNNPLATNLILVFTSMIQPKLVLSHGWSYAQILKVTLFFDKDSTHPLNLERVPSHIGVLPIKSLHILISAEIVGNTYKSEKLTPIGDSVLYSEYAEICVLLFVWLLLQTYSDRKLPIYLVDCGVQSYSWGNSKHCLH